MRKFALVSTLFIQEKARKINQMMKAGRIENVCRLVL